MNRNNHIKKDKEIAIKSEDTNKDEEKVKRVSIYNIKSSHPLFTYCDEITFKSKNLRNAANYHIRRCFIYHNRDEISSDIQEYFEQMNQYIQNFNKEKKKNKVDKLKKLREIRNQLKATPLKQKELMKVKNQIEEERKRKYFTQNQISEECGTLFYEFLNYYYVHCIHNDEENPYKDLPAKTSQQILRNLNKDWKGFFKSIKDFSKNPTKYTGKPNIPGYKKKDGRAKVSFTYQQCKIVNGYVTFPKTELTLKIGIESAELELKEVRIVPMGVNYKIELVWNKKKSEENNNLDKNAYMGIDLGVSNFATLTNNIGLSPIIINGRQLKSMNQYYNKKRAELQSKLPFYKANDDLMKQISWSKKLSLLTEKRNNKITDFMHNVSSFVIDYCLRNKIATIVIGLNNDWKQQLNIGKKNNQMFISIPFKKFIDQIQYKSEDVGITVIVREESYTSKASFFDLDEIPTYKKDNKTKYAFSGKRKYRGLYITKDGKYINADVNGSYNILRKEFPQLFTKETIKYLSFKPMVVNII